MASPPLTNREYAYLRIIGKGDHKIITDTLGIEPTNAWNEGDDNPRNNRPRKFTSWQLESGLDDTNPVKDHLEKLFAKLEPIQQKLLSLSQWFGQKLGGDSSISSEFFIVRVIFYPSWIQRKPLNK